MFVLSAVARTIPTEELQRLHTNICRGRTELCCMYVRAIFLYKRGNNNTAAVCRHLH